MTTISAADYQKLQKGKGSARARTKTTPSEASSKPRKATPKVQSANEQMDISETPAQAALSLVIVKNIGYCEYTPEYIRFEYEGQFFRLDITPEK